ncbi:MAG: hypothetical protein O3B09_01915, partial [Proteobacteria bacterium]|nr:hypothetical protein [Pseudomonadota bacterium]
KKGVLYSLPMQFFGKIINLTDDRYPLSFNDMSEDLANKKMAFGNVSLQVQGEEDNDKHFAAMFSVKEYNEISVSILDKILQLPQEFIISQSIDFIDRNKALLSFDYQNYILDISEDDQLKYLSGLDSIIDSDSGSITDYGKQQITLMLINRNTGGLQDDIDNALSALHELGLVTVREDIFSEHCFWSQLPGNFKFLRRQKAINVSRIAGFASLHNFPAGSRMDNHWGDAVTIFRTVLGTPYFFNFHDGDAGHTMIIGPLGSGKTVLLNFLVGQSRKFNNRLFYFGYNRSAKIFINAIEGNYLSITNKLEHPNALKINPLTLIDRPDSEKFLSDWFGYLVNYGGDKIEDEEMKLIPAIVKKIITKKIKKLSDAAALFKTQQTKNIYKKLSIWHSKGKYAFIFDHEAENDFSKDLVNAFDLSPILKQKALLIPVISYLLHRVEISLDGKPAMIVLDEAWKLIDNYATGPKINDFLDRMEKKNCVIIFATESAKDAAQSSITKGIDRSVVTRIFLPDEEPTNYYKSVFGLNDDEFNILSAMSSEERHFLLKRGEDAIIASLDLSAINNVIAVLSSNPQNIGLMEAMKRKYGKKSADWVPEFFNALPQ